MPDYSPVISRLTARTKEEKLRWKATSMAGLFITSLQGEFTFEISKLTDNAYSFSMTDNEGNKVVDHLTRPGDAYFKPLEGLFQLAQSSAMDITKKINEAASLLDKV